MDKIIQCLKYVDISVVIRNSSITQEAEIGRIMVQSQSWANNSQDPILKKPITEKGG
jgi:hypothetical protein